MASLPLPLSLTFDVWSAQAATMSRQRTWKRLRITDSTLVQERRKFHRNDARSSTAPQRRQGWLGRPPMRASSPRSRSGGGIPAFASARASAVGDV